MRRLHGSFKRLDGNILYTRSMKSIFALLLVLHVSLFAMMRDEAAFGYHGVIYVSADYEEDFEVPQGSLLHVKVEDVSRNDVIATMVMRQQRKISGYPPFSLKLDLDPEALRPERRYNLRVMILKDDTLLFTTTYAIDPKKGPYDITLTKVRYSQ